MNAVAVIMAGGRGTRFWPLSRRSRPKQLLRLFGERSMLQSTVDRVRPLMGPERVLVVTSTAIEAAVRAELRELPEENILVEPCGRNTAPCVAWAALVARARFGADVALAVLAADHHVARPEELRAVLRSALHTAATGVGVTLGITPTRPETGYGYLQVGETLPPAPGATHAAKALKAFVEKPSLEVATRYLAQGDFLWNSGTFFFTAAWILDELRTYLPALLAALEPLVDAAGFTDQASLLRVYPELDAISLDYGVMERSQRLVALPAEFGWSDVGTWAALLPFRDEGAASYTRGRVLEADCEGSVLVAEEGTVLVARGLRDLAVIAGPDATLVLPLSRDQEVREVVKTLQREGLDTLLE